MKIVTILDLLFADDAALVAHSAQDLQTVLNQFSLACSNFGLTICLKKTKIIIQGTNILQSIARIFYNNFLFQDQLQGYRKCR